MSELAVRRDVHLEVGEYLVPKRYQVQILALVEALLRRVHCRKVDEHDETRLSAAVQSPSDPLPPDDHGALRCKECADLLRVFREHACVALAEGTQNHYGRLHCRCETLRG